MLGLNARVFCLFLYLIAEWQFNFDVSSLAKILIGWMQKGYICSTIQYHIEHFSFSLFVLFNQTDITHLVPFCPLFAFSVFLCLLSYSEFFLVLTLYCHHSSWSFCPPLGNTWAYRTRSKPQCTVSGRSYTCVFTRNQSTRNDR